MSKCQPKTYSVKGVTTYYQRFSGSGKLCLVDSGHLSGTVWVNLLYQTSPDLSNPYHVEGERVELDDNNQCVDLKSTGEWLVGYQVQNCYADDVVFNFEYVDYSDGYPAP